jgi:rod shape-determining protein MreB
VSRDLAIDLGTANTLVYARGQGIVLNEPTVIALNSRTQEVLAMGHEAWHMIGRTPGHIVAVRPLRGGAITDFEITQRLIRLIFARAGITRLQRARVLVCVPSAITHVEQRAVLEATRRAGAAQTYLIEQPMAAAIGASLPIHEPLGNMVVDIGGGTSEMAVISMGGIVSLQAVRVGGFDFDAAISAYLRRDHGIAVGERTAEEIKLAIGSAFPTADEFKAEVRGRDLMSGLPRTIVLEPEEIREGLDEPIQRVLGSVKQALAETPPELAQDLLEMGIHLVGGGGMLRGFDRRIEHETGVPVRMSEMPLETVVLGAGRCLESFDRLRDMFMDRPRGSGPRSFRSLSAAQGTCAAAVRSLASTSAPSGRCGAASPEWSRPAPTCRNVLSSTYSKSSAAWRTCQSLSSSAAASAASTLGPLKGASASTARRRTAGLSWHAANTAGSPASAPSAPIAATAASRAIGSR